MIKNLQAKFREHLPKSQKSSRLVKAVACFIVAAVLAFTMQVTAKETSGHIDIVKVKTAIEAGNKIEKSDLETVSVGSYGLPENICFTVEQVAGKYATAAIYPADFITSDKLSDTKEDPFTALDTGKKIMSFTVPSLAASVANNIKAGDIIQVMYTQTFAVQNEINEISNTVAPDCLKNLVVIDIKDSDGYREKKDKDANESSNMYSTKAFIPAVITVEVDDQQAKELVKAENSKNIYVIFIRR